MTEKYNSSYDDDDDNDDGTESQVIKARQTAAAMNQKQARK